MTVQQRADFLLMQWQMQRRLASPVCQRIVCRPRGCRSCSAFKAPVGGCVVGRQQTMSLVSSPQARLTAADTRWITQAWHVWLPTWW